MSGRGMMAAWTKAPAKAVIISGQLEIFKNEMWLDSFSSSINLMLQVGKLRLREVQ